MKFKLNTQGVRQLLKSNEMMDVILKKSKLIANKVNKSKTDKMIGKNRVNSRIYSSEKNNDLLKALYSSKGI